MKKIVSTLIFATTIFTTTGLQGGPCFSSCRQTLDLSSEENVTTEELEEILKERGHKLKTINLRGQTGDLSFGIISTYCRDLEELCLASTKILNAQLLQILENNLSLRKISLAECLFLKSGIGSIISLHCNNLKWLDISYTNITENDILTLRAAYGPPLHLPIKLLIRGCTNSTF